MRGTLQERNIRLTVRHDWNILWNVQVNTAGGRNVASSSSPSPVTHLATLETCTRISTEFCKTSYAMRYFHADFIAHKEAFIILGNTFLGRFATVKFLERMRVPKISSRTTYHETISHSRGSESDYELLQSHGDTYFNSMLTISPIFPK